MRHVPGTCIRVAFVPEGAAAHSQEYLDAGKTEAAHNAVVYGERSWLSRAHSSLKTRKSWKPSRRNSMRIWPKN